MFGRNGSAKAHSFKIAIVRDVGVKGQVSFVADIPLIGPILNLVSILFVFRENRRCVHDHIAGTVVVTPD